MRAILVRVGIDQAYGKWNAPADEATGEFVYVPIPEGDQAEFAHGARREFSEFIPALKSFAGAHRLDVFRDLRFPEILVERAAHLDPDFEHLTYGDDGANRGSEIKQLSSGDLLVFYAGLRAIAAGHAPLVYAIVGLYKIDRIVKASDLPKAEHHKNAHTRKKSIWPSDIVVLAASEGSGRLRRYLPIGELRNRAYRVRRELLEAWGGLSVKDGFSQRSARPPRFTQPERFYSWFGDQDTQLVARNNP